MVKLTSCVCPQDVLLRMHPFALHIGPYGNIRRMSRQFLVTSLGHPWDVIFPSRKKSQTNEKKLQTSEENLTKY